MKSLKILVLLSIILFGCKGNEKDGIVQDEKGEYPNYYKMLRSIKHSVYKVAPYYKDYKSELVKCKFKKNIYTKCRKIYSEIGREIRTKPIRFQYEIFDTPESKGALAAVSTDENNYTIFINKNLFEEKDSLTQYGTLIHELAHFAFSRKHMIERHADPCKYYDDEPLYAEFCLTEVSTIIKRPLSNCSTFGKFSYTK